MTSGSKTKDFIAHGISSSLSLFFLLLVPLDGTNKSAQAAQVDAVYQESLQRSSGTP